MTRYIRQPIKYRLRHPGTAAAQKRRATEIADEHNHLHAKVNELSGLIREHFMSEKREADAAALRCGVCGDPDIHDSWAFYKKAPPPKYNPCPLCNNPICARTHCRLSHDTPDSKHSCRRLRKGKP